VLVHTAFHSSSRPVDGELVDAASQRCALYDRG